MKPFKNEEALAADVAKWLADWGWDIYPEVTILSGRADIVAVKGRITWIVETKMSMSLDVIEQARYWLTSSTLVSVAVPSARPSRARVLAERICKQYGIGIIYAFPLDSEFTWAAGRWGTVAPRWNRKAYTKDVIGALSESHKKYAPGNAKNSYHTVFAETCARLKKYLNTNPGSTIKEVVASIDHHYANDSSARGALLTWIDQGVIDGIKVDKSSKPYRFYSDNFEMKQPNGNGGEV